MLSTAFTTKSSPSQKSLLKVSSVLGATREVMDFTYKSLFINWATLPAHSDFEWPMSLFLKRNCQFKLDFSMLSLSVTVILPPWDFVPTPIRAKALRY